MSYLVPNVVWDDHTWLHCICRWTSDEGDTYCACSSPGEEFTEPAMDLSATFRSAMQFAAEGKHFALYITIPQCVNTSASRELSQAIQPILCTAALSSYHTCTGSIARQT